MKVVPLGDRIMVERIEAEEMTKGGIVLPDTAKEKPTEGKVVAVGPGKVSDEGTTMPLTVKVNDRIIFSSYAGTEVKVGDKELLIMSEDDVLAIVRPDKPAKSKKRRAGKKK